MAIYIGNQKINVSGVDKVYVGSQLIYQKTTAVLVSISLSGATTSLNRGDTFSFGGVVTATYSDSSTADVTANTTFSGYNMATAGTYTVTASYTEDGITKTATYTLTVNKAWTTLWSGSKSISWYTKNTTPSDVDVYSSSTLPNTSDIRVTFTMSNKQGSAGKYTVNGTATTTKPSSPYRFSTFDPTANKYLLGVSANNNTGMSYVIYLRWVKSTNKFILTCTKSTSGTEYWATISLSVTKIERYY